MPSERPSEKRQPGKPRRREGDSGEAPQRPKGKRAAPGSARKPKPSTRKTVPPVPDPPPAPPAEAETPGATPFIVTDGDDGLRRRPTLVQRLGTFAGKVRQRPALAAGIVAGLLLVGFATSYLLDGGPPPTGDGVVDDDIDRLPPGDVPLPDDVAGTVQLFTKPAPGFLVLVDGEPVRTEDGEMLATPCEVVLDARHSHRITVAKEGFRDATKLVTPSTDAPTELVYEPEPDPANQSESQLDAPWFGAKVGQPIELAALNTPELQSDPFVTPDGLNLYYVSTGLSGSSIHVATRPSPFHPFVDPRSIPTTSSFNVPRSPGVISIGDPDSGDVVTHLVYTAKSRVQSVVRRNVLQGFGDDRVFRYDPDRGDAWTATQMIDGGRALYWTANRNGGPQTYFSARNDLDLDFEKTLKVKLPGGVPSLSADGLRQYVYDGRTLQRARRATMYEWGTEKKKGNSVAKLTHVPFSELETVVELPLEDYVATDGYRQFFVSDDEQWMFYTNDPTRSGNLFAVRLREGRGWGRRPRGRSIENKDFSPEVIATNYPDDAPPTTPGDDPRDKPLPYTSHRTEFETLMAARDYEAAAALVERRLGETEFASSRTMLEWDRDDAERVRGMWADATKGAASLQAGEEFRNKSVKLAFERFEDGTLVGSLGGETYEIAIAEMAYTDVAALATRHVADDDVDGQLRIATFLHYEPDAGARAVETRLKRAGDLADGFTERIAGRMLEQARQEFDRENFRPGLAWLTRLRETAPDSDAALQSESLENDLYLKMSWEKVGPRKWTGGLTGEYAAGPERAADSWLLSPEAYEGFELQMDYKVTARNGSGGVYFRYAEPNPRRGPYRNNAAFKIHLANDAGIAPDAVSTGALFSIEAPTRNASNRAGEWNAFRMKVQGQKVQVWINDRLVLDTVANNPAIPLTGYVALDGIPGGITYRRILLLELPASF